MKLDQTILDHVGRLPHALQGEVLDYVLFLEQRARTQPVAVGDRRERLAGVLERLVALDPFANIDPREWERKQREDRPLPGHK